MKTRMLVAILFALVLVVPAFAGNQLSIRLVEVNYIGGSGGEEGVGVGLEDVIDILKRNLASANYRLVDSCVVALPADETRTIGEYTLKCSGTRRNLAVTVLRFGKQVLRTANVPVQPDKPFIIGGLPGKLGPMLLVFVAI